MNEQLSLTGECPLCAATRASMSAFARTVQYQATELDALRAHVAELEAAATEATA